MANVKNFGLTGVGSDIQLGKGGVRLVNDTGTFSFRGANGLTAAAVTASSVTATSGDVAINTGKLTIGETSLSRYAASVLKFDGTGATVLPVGTAAQRPAGAAGMIRVFQDGGAASLEYYDGTTWSTVSTTSGGIETEVNNIEASLGPAVNADGTFNGAAFTGAAAGATSFTDAINKAATGGSGGDLDTIFPGTAAGNLIYFDGTNWQQALPGSTSGAQAWDAALDSISGLTTSADQMIYTTAANTYTTTTLTGFARGLLDDVDATAAQGTLGLTIGTNVQAYDAGLAALAAKTSTGIMVQTGNDTYVSRSLVAPAAGLTISDADGVAGAPTFALADDLLAIEGLSGSGFAVRTGANTWTERVITGTDTRIVVTNGDGVTSSPTIDLASVTQGSTGSFVKITVDGYGRVTGNTAVVASDVTSLINDAYVNVTGDTMSGNLNMGGTNTVTGLIEPVNASDAATKNYVDNAVTGITWKPAVQLMSDVNVALTGASGTLVIDGHAALGPTDAGYRILLINQTVTTEEGIYVYSDNGTDYTLSRAADSDTYQELEGASVFVLEGTVYAASGWVQSNHYLTGFNGQTWVQFSGAGSYSAGDGISILGNVVSAKIGDGLVFDGSEAITLNISSGSALSKTQGIGTDELALLLDGGSASGLEQSATGLKISATGVTNAMLANSSIVLDADTGTGSVALGGTLNIIGTVSQGVSTSVTGADITLTVSDASTTQKGVASFSSTTFTVTSGAVDLKAGGISNSQLANSTITISDGTATDPVALGETLTIAGSGAISTAVTANTATISVATATSAVLGVASFSSSDFTVTAGAVTLNAIDLATGDVTGILPVANGGTGAGTFTAGRVLLGNGTSTITEDADLAFNAGTNTLTIGSATITADAASDVTISATSTDADINLVPNGTGVVNIGATSAGVITSEVGQTLTVRGNNTLVLDSTSGDIVLTLTSGTTSKVTVAGPDPWDYATDLADEDLTNKVYVDAIQSGNVKSYMATINTWPAGTYTLGTVPDGGTVIRVKVLVLTASDAGSLQVGTTGIVDEFMTNSENDITLDGMYIAETCVTVPAPTDIVITRSGATTGQVRIIVEYTLA